MIAKVLTDVAVDREFDYLIPPALEGQVVLGSRVNVSFGHRQTQGYVVGFSATSAHLELKAIESVVGSKPYIRESLLKLARWMADYYCAPVELAVQAVLPGAVRHRQAKFKEQLFVELVEMQKCLDVSMELPMGGRACCAPRTAPRRPSQRSAP